MKNIKKIGIAGAGTMGSSMAETFAKYGYEVTLFDIFGEALKKAERLIGINQKTEVAEGLVSEEKSQDLMKRIKYTAGMEKLADSDIVIEAILEKIEVKHDFWGKISKIVSKDAVLASNTSGLSITKIAEVVEQPERFAGMHWINPPHIIPLIEVIRGEKTSEETADAIHALAEAVGKKPVIVKDAPGFVLNRIQLAILRECLYIVEEGIATPEDVDRVMKYALGVRYACLGPFEVSDHGGLDIFYNIASYLFEDLCDEKRPFGMLAEAFENGRYGVKSRSGFYDYSDGKDEAAIMHRDQMYTKISKCLFGE